jgi:NADPH-dependent 2,4-dienoyl-CoA reductase/sulfur reductase-like enzyme
MLQSTVVDGSPTLGLVVISGEKVHIVRAPRVIIATGARELFLPFPGWTLPNVMGGGGAQALLKGGMQVRGKHVIVAGCGPLLLPVAAALSRAGATVRHVIEQASALTVARFAMSLLSQPAKLMLAARYRSAIPLRAYHTGRWITRADGGTRVETVTLTDGREQWTEPCDLLCCSYGLVPSTDLARLLGCAVENGAVVVDSFQRTTIPGVYCAGESTGVAGDDASVAEGEIAGLAAAAPHEARIPPGLLRRRDLGRRFQHHLMDAFRVRAEILRLADADTVVCRCEDVRFGRLERAWTGRQAKLYTRIGMGPCQGAVCGPAVQHLFGWTAGAVRPPLFAPELGVWAASGVDRPAATSAMPSSEAGR